MKYNELHLFIDESGNFIENTQSDFLLVGGVLLFGQYDEVVESGLKNAIVDACRHIGIDYPVHYNSLDKSKVKFFSQRLSQDLTAWRTRTDTPIYGAFIQYKEDIFYDAADILAEREFDNRYVQMLWSLIEYLCFASDKVNKRLADDAAIHLHIAHRNFPIPRNEELKETYQVLGYNVIEDLRSPNRYLVKTALRKSDITAMFRLALRNRWGNSQRQLTSVNLEKIQYHLCENTTPAMYLADIVLGVERKRLQQWNGLVTQQTLPILENLEYSKTLEAAIKCKSYIAEDNINALLGSLANEPFDANDLRNLDLLNALVKEFKQDKTPFYQLYETAIRNINHPARRKKGLRLQQLLDAVHEKSGLNDLQMSLHAIQTDMAYHDHTGNVELGDADWEQYLQLEPQLNKLAAAKAMEFYTDFRCKRAVNLMDTFRYNEAGEVLIAAGQKEEEFAKNVSEMFGGNEEDFPKERRGWVYSSLGQVFAFQGNKERADEMFRNALQCFDKQGDIEREWVYLGHLACDFPNESQALLNEVLEHLPQSTNPLEEPFILALKLKTAYIFGTQEQQRQWTDDILTFVNRNAETLPMEHPWGLIYQMTAMLLAKLGDCEHAEFMFDHAIRSFNQGEGILKDLGKYCQLRKNGKEVPPQIRFNYW
ncbi:hypothetical protein FACS189454_09040 [Planctomycetales bacterium]|nr:hypothetical protein FACS189454_09040 [Planctomycetales bacterium]